MMKKFLVLMLAMVLFAVSTTSALASSSYANLLEKVLGEKKLVVGTSPDYAPYEFIDLSKTGEDAIVGADISLAKYLAEQLGVELVIEPMDFDTVLASVGNASCDLALAGMVPKAEREAIMSFTDVYYNDGDQVVLIMKDKADTFQTLKDFAGKTVAGQNGTLQVEMIQTQLLDTKVELITAIPNAVLMLQSGKVDGVALASVVAEQYVKNYPDLAICAEKFQYESLGVAGAIPKDEPEFQAKLNEILEGVAEQGLYYQWIDEANELASSQQP